MKIVKLWMTCIPVIFSIFILMSASAYAQRTVAVAVDGDWAPMKMKDDKGNLTGYEIDMIKAIGAEGGFQVNLVEVPWENIFYDLDAGKFDAVMASVSITDKRKEKFDFSQPYFSAEQLLVVRKSSVSESLKGKTIAAFEATTGAAALKKSELVEKRFYPVEVMERPFLDLADGKVDGVLCDTPVAINYAFMKDAYKGKFAIGSERTVLGKPSATEDYAVAVKKGNTDVLALINKGIKAVAAKGIDARLKAKWIRW